MNEWKKVFVGATATERSVENFGGCGGFRAVVSGLRLFALSPCSADGAYKGFYRIECAWKANRSQMDRDESQRTVSHPGSVPSINVSALKYLNIFDNPGILVFPFYKSIRLESSLKF
jgi:hypothetical protein